MALLLTCDCGARFEIEDTLAGTTVLCPECHESLRAPELKQVARRTSTLALASVVLALVGAFTVVGTVAAVIVGLVAVGVIASRRDRLAGYGFAAFGILAGLAFTALTLLALSRSELLGLGGWIGESQMGHQLQTGGPLLIRRPADGYEITRPTEKWGIIQGAQLDDPAVAPLQLDLDLLLANPRLFAFVDVRVDTSHPELGAQASLSHVFDQMRDLPPPDPWGWRDPEVQEKVVVDEWQFNQQKIQTKEGDLDGWEAEGVVSCGPRRWHMIIRLYKRPGKPLYVVRGYAPRNRFRQAREEVVEALDSFRLLK